MCNSIAGLHLYLSTTAPTEGIIFHIMLFVSFICEDTRRQVSITKEIGRDLFHIKSHLLSDFYEDIYLAVQPCINALRNKSNCTVHVEGEMFDEWPYGLPSEESTKGFFNVDTPSGYETEFELRNPRKRTREEMMA
jgi:hypothetical protein